MYERMLNKQEMPTIEDMTEYCGATKELFTLLNEWIFKTYDTAWQITFPYGNKYGWGVAHKKKQKLICNIFAEDNAFTVMIRLSNKQFESIYESLKEDTQEMIDNKFPCGDGGWIHYRVTCKEQFDDIQKILSVKCSRP